MSNRCVSVIIKILQFFLTVVIVFLLIHKLDFRANTLLVGIHAKNFLICAIFISLIVLPIISSNRWAVFLKQIGAQESPLRLIKIILISLFQGVILPSSQGQDVLRIIHIESLHPEHRGEVGSTILIERLLGFIILCILSFSFTCIVTLPKKKEILIIISGITVALAIVVLLLLNKRINAYLSSMHFKNVILNKCHQYISKFSNSMVYFPYKKVLGSSIVLILIYQLSTISSVALVFKAYGVNLPFTTHISLYPIISILSLIPITISGFGIREGFFVYFYSQLGVPAEIAVSVSLMNYMVLTLVPALIGAVLYVIDIFIKKQIE